MSIKKTCEYCGKIFDALKNKTRFCCRKCADLSHRRQNEFIYYADYAEIIIKNIHGVFKSKVDLNKVFELKKHCWNVRKNKNKWYVEARNRESELKERIHLHRLIANTPDDMVTDHINGDSLDNRFCNLRNVNQHYNTLNRHSCNSGTGYIGVYKNGNKYIAKISNKTLGFFDDINDAIKCRKNALDIYQKEIAEGFNDKKVVNE